MNLSKATLALFLTGGSSLSAWDKVGLLDREIAPYNKLAKQFGHIYIISYGDETELRFRPRLAKNISILYKKNRLPSLLFQLILPFKYRVILRGCQIYKTNQIYGSLPALISKIIYHGKLVIRSGYIASLNASLYKRSLVKRWYTNCLEYWAYRLCDLALITTAENAEFLIRRYTFLKKRLKIVNNSIDSGLFRPMAITKKFDIGYVGRLEKDKNLVNLLQAVSGSRLTVCFIGQGPEKKRLLEIANEHHINFTQIDRVDNHKLPEHYNQFKVFVFPSLHEGNPKSLLEAMACALPVVGCDVVGVNNLIQNNINGILTSTNTDGIRQAVDKMFLDKQINLNLGRAARAYVVRQYDIDDIIKKESNLYQVLLTTNA